LGDRDHRYKADDQQHTAEAQMMRSHHGVALFVLASQPRVRMGLTKSDCNMQSIFASIDRSLSETLQIGNL
jgi:hypothetical protein